MLPEARDRCQVGPRALPSNADDYATRQPQQPQIDAMYRAAITKTSSASKRNIQRATSAGYV
jgi:hypothetical protein